MPTTPSTNGLKQGPLPPAGPPNAETEGRLPLRAEEFGDVDGEHVLGVLLAYGREALDLATQGHGLERRDFFRVAHKAIYDAIALYQPEHHLLYPPENVLETIAREGLLPEPERPLRGDLEAWRSRGNAYGLESMAPYVERLKAARVSRTRAQTVARAHAALDAGDVAGAQALLQQLLVPIGISATRSSSPTLREWSGAELVAAPDDSLPGSLPLLGERGYVIRGWSHLLAGYSRVGKTELAARLVREWLDLGETVLWLSEEPRSLWIARLKALPPPEEPGDWSGLRVVDALGEEPERLLDRAAGGEETIVVLDTLRNLLRPQDEKDNSEMSRLTNPWIDRVCRRAEKTLFALHHLTKLQAEHGMNIAGGHALMACFDVPLVVTFDDKADRRRVLESHARLTRPPKLLYELREDGTMRALGSPEGVAIAVVRERCRGLLSGDWLRTSEVQQLLEEPRPAVSTVRDALLLSAREGEVERDPPLSDGRAQGKTWRWRAPRQLVAAEIAIGTRSWAEGGEG